MSSVDRYRRSILFITVVFDPEPQLKGLSFCLELAKKNDISVLTGFPNYPRGKIYGNFKNQWRIIENVEGITVIRRLTWPSISKQPIIRLFKWSVLAIGLVLEVVKQRSNCDVVYLCAPPLPFALPILIAARLLRVPVIYDVQDPWPHTLTALLPAWTKIFQPIIRLVARYTYSLASSIVVQNNEAKHDLENLGIGRPVSVIFNWSPNELADNYRENSLVDHVAIEKMSDDKRIRLIYTGNVGRAQNLVAMFKRLSRVLDYKKISFYVFGGGSQFDELVELGRSPEYQKFLYVYPQIGLAEVNVIMQFADFGLVAIEPIVGLENVFPAKVQTYLYGKLPMVSTLTSGELCHFLRRNNLGVSVDLFDYGSAIKCECPLDIKLTRYLDSFKPTDPREFYEKKMSFKAGVAHFSDLIEKVGHV